MSELLLRMIGASNELVSNVEQVDWLWARPTWLIVGLVLLAPISWYIVYRHRKNLPHVADAPRRTLSACRIGVLLLLIVVIGGPYVRLDEQIEKKPVLAVIVDESASMNLPAGPFGEKQMRSIAQVAGLAGSESDDGSQGGQNKSDPKNNEKDGKGTDKGDAQQKPQLTAELRKKLAEMSRADLLDAVLQRHQPMMAQLRERFDVRTYRVAREVRRIPAAKRQVEPLSDVAASQTALGEAVRRAIDEATGRRMAGIMLLTDGRSTRGVDPVRAVRDAGGEGDGEQGGATPVWAVPIGSSDPAADLMIADVLAPQHVTQGDSVAVVTTVRSRKLAGREVAVTLLDGEKKLSEKTIVLTQEPQQRVQLAYSPDQAGAKVLTVKVAHQSEENVTANNERTLRLRVGTQKLKLLYVEGTPRWDFRFLDHALRRDRGMDTTFVMEAALLAEGVKPEKLPKAAGLPTEPEGFAEYHAVMLGDASPKLLRPGVLEALAAAVREEGVGLLVQAGTEHMPHMYLDGPLGELLPMRFEGIPGAGGETGEDERPGLQAEAFAPFRMNVTAEGSMHPAFSLYPSASKNRRLWSRMPTFHWAFPGSELKPGATLLAEMEAADQTRPLIGQHYAGRGRVMVVGTDGTFRWRRNIGSELFYRFWGQAIRDLARQRSREGDRSWLEATPGQVEPGDRVSLEVFAVGGGGKPLRKDRVTVQVQQKQVQKRIELTGGAEQGRYRGVWRPQQPGRYTVRYTDPRGRKTTATVHVADANLERLHPTVDREMLGTLAQVSRGGLIELPELSRLPERLKGEPVTASKVTEQEVWDNWLTLVLLLALYCTDVGIRRVLGLT